MKAAIVLVSLFLASVAGAASGPSKPSICATFELVKGKRGEVAVCYDGSSPKVYKTWSIVDWRDEDGKPARYMLGF